MDSLSQELGAHYNRYPIRIFVSSTHVEDGTRVLGLSIRGQNGLAVATQVQRVSYACVGPGW